MNPLEGSEPASGDGSARCSNLFARAAAKQLHAYEATVILRAKPERLMKIFRIMWLTHVFVFQGAPHGARARQVVRAAGPTAHRTPMNLVRARSQTWPNRRWVPRYSSAGILVLT